jgi:1-phosphofructokinase family hexose kinase
MVTTVTLTLMLDKTVAIDHLRHAAITRASSVSMIVGGKGVNVSRQLKALGEESVATGFVGGETGSMIERLLESEKIPHQFVRVAGMTREGVTYRETDGTATSVFEPPAEVTGDEAARLVEKSRLLAQRSDWVVCSGSSPCPAADGVFREIILDSRKRGIPVACDSYGPAFARAVEALPDLIKPNREEFTRTFGSELPSLPAMMDAARETVRKGVRYCIITDGAHPFAAASREGVWSVVPPEVNAVNPTGSGDCLVAGVLHGLLQGWSFADALAFGAAAGSANALVWDVAISKSEDIVALLPQVKIVKA